VHVCVCVCDSIPSTLLNGSCMGVDTEQNVFVIERVCVHVCVCVCDSVPSTLFNGSCMGVDTEQTVFVIERVCACVCMCACTCFSPQHVVERQLHGRGHRPEHVLDCVWA